MGQKCPGLVHVERNIELRLLRFAGAPPSFGADHPRIVLERQRFDLPIISGWARRKLELAQVVILRVKSVACQIDRGPRGRGACRMHGFARRLAGRPLRGDRQREPRETRDDASVRRCGRGHAPYSGAGNVISAKRHTPFFAGATRDDVRPIELAAERRQRRRVDIGAIEIECARCATAACATRQCAAKSKPFIEIERRQIGAYPESRTLRFAALGDRFAEQQQTAIERCIQRGSSEQQSTDRSVVDRQQLILARRRRITPLDAQRNGLVGCLAERRRQIDRCTFERRLDRPRRRLRPHVDG